MVFSLSLYMLSLSVISSVKPSLGPQLQRHPIFPLLFISFDLIVRQSLGWLKLVEL